MTFSRPALTDRQIARMQYRLQLFQRRGLTESAADVLADRLADRDYERDDRYVCLECQHLQQSGHCFAAKQGWLMPHTSPMTIPIPDLLQRCPRFAFQTPT